VPFNFRLNVLQVFRRLGIQTGAALPQLDENVQMTMLLTDLSKLVPAPIEPRGLAGVNFASAVGLFSAVQLQSLSAGGIFVETLIFRASGFAASENYMIDVTLTDLGMPGLPGHINVGGTPVSSRFTGDQIAVATAGVSIPASAANQSIVLTPGIFVPNQSFFSITTRTANENLDVAFIYRELPSVEEVG